MSTEGQKIDRLRLRSYIKRNQLSGVLNDTKWRQLFRSLESKRLGLPFKRKDVRDSDDLNEHWDHDIYHVFGAWENIEWLEIRAVVRIRQGALLPPIEKDFTNELIAAVTQAGVPYSKTEDGIKVWGYLRPGDSPEWCT